MANERNPNDPNQRDPADNDVRRAAPVDNELQADLGITENSASGRRTALVALVVAVILGAVFYGINSSKGPTESSSTAPQSTTESTAQNNASKPPVAPGVRDVTPSNTQSGVTTGAAPANSTQPANPQSGNTPPPGAAK